MARVPALLLVLLLAFSATSCLASGEEAAGEPDADQPGETADPAEERPTETAEPAGPAETAEPAEEDAPADEPEFSRLEGVTTAQAYAAFADEGLGRWQTEVPGVEDVRIPSSSDAYQQPALWLAPAREGPAPLLVVLHSWSSEYRQHQGIPFARWAHRHGWAMIAPNFRGVFDRPQAMGSDLAVQDVVDAIDWAAGRADLDEERVFAVGLSGGGMMSLLLAGRHPERFRGVVSWVPVYDVVDFYVYNRDVRDPSPAYVQQILAACGGDPTADEAARADCRHRSPRTHLDAAREAGIPVYIGHGLQDDIVRPSAALLAFNRLADPADRVPDEVIGAAFRKRLPDDQHGSVEAETFYGAADPEVRFARRSGPVTVVLFEGDHDMVYHPGLEWMLRVGHDE